ncbi:hypothetical protein [Streptomyces umbrinus]|uniref:hypothetical protein n=1 Tax=Streptomyces umbrinus TaxID=67370 RepID=UPI003C2C0DAE
MEFIGGPSFPAQTDIRVRQADLGRDGSVSTIGMARWLEDARIRVQMPRFKRIVNSGNFVPFSIFLASQNVQRLESVSRTELDIQVHTGIRRIGRTSFTYEQSVLVDNKRTGGGGATVVLLGTAGPLALPHELITDLTDLQMPELSQTPALRPGAERSERDHYTYFAPLRARIGDVDSNQHVNFIALTTWYDEAVAAFTSDAVGADEGSLVPDLPPWSYRIQYTGEVTYPGTFEVGLVVRTFDAASVHYELGVFRSDICLGTADAIGARGDLPEKFLKAYQSESLEDRFLSGPADQA